MTSNLSRFINYIFICVSKMIIKFSFLAELFLQRYSSPKIDVLSSYHHPNFVPEPKLNLHTSATLLSTKEVWKNVAWSDEFRFLLQHSDGGVRIWRKQCLKGTSSAHHLQSTIPKVKCAGRSLMLLGTEAHIRAEEKLNAPKYWNSLNENPLQSIQNLKLGRKFTF